MFVWYECPWENRFAIDYSSVSVQHINFIVVLCGRSETDSVCTEKSIIRNEIVIAEPAELAIEEVEVILSHPERFAELSAEKEVFFA